jgi:hypothetical protein
MPGLYPTVLFVHVVAATALVGHSLGTPIMRAVMRGAATLGELRTIVGVEARLARFNPLIALLLLVTGGYLGTAGWSHMEWFRLAVAGWVVNSVLALTVVKGRMQALGKAVAGDGPVTREADALRQSTPLTVALQVMLANNLALLFLMMLKPPLLEALGAFAVANVLLVGSALLPRRTARSAHAAPMTEAGSPAR